MRYTALKRSSALLLATGLVFGLASCSDDEDDDATDTTDTTAAADDSGNDAAEDAAEDEVEDEAAESGEFIISISGSQFEVVPVASDEVITISNDDGFTHTVTSDDDAWESVSVGGGETADLPALDPGDYDFHCEIHTSMQATLTVS